MAVQKAMTTGTNGVMDWFDRNATSPYYSVCEIISPTKKELLFSCNEDSVDNARRILEENISAFEQNGVNTLYALILHPKKDKTGYITMNTPSHAMLKFRPAELEQPVYGIGAYTGGGGGSNRYEMEKIMEKLTMLESKLAETDQDEYDETFCLCGHFEIRCRRNDYTKNKCGRRDLPLRSIRKDCASGALMLL